VEEKTKKSVVAILRVLQGQKKPLGATRIGREIHRFGINLSQRTVRYYLAWTDRQGFTRKFGRRGRMITSAGTREVSDSFVIEKVGLVVSRIDELSYRMTFSLSKQVGSIILNISTIKGEDLRRALKQIQPVFEAGLAMGRLMIVRERGGQLGDFAVPESRVAIGTVCSVTVNGIFLREGIPVISRFGGLLEMRNGQPVRFTQLINYDGTTLDPLEIFIKGKMTTVGQVATTGSGIIGASFREIPSAATPRAERLRKKLEQIGLGAILVIGEPGQPLLDIPVGEGRTGMIVLPGLNPLAACEEAGIETGNLAMGTLFEFSELVPFQAHHIASALS
jgi:repressor of nif and glnA expression